MGSRKRMTKINLQNVSVGIISITTIIAASIVLVITITELRNFGIAYGQVNATSLTPEQKAAICNPSNLKLKVVNTTESKICGIPVTVPPRSNSSNITTGAQAPPPPPNNSAG